MKRLLPLAFALSLIAIWETAASAIPDIKFFVSTPSSSITFAVTHLPSLFDATCITATETISGFLLAVALSSTIMLLCLYWPPFFTFILPIFVTSQILPMITLAPLFIILFGMGLLSKIAMVALMCFFPIFINFSSGVESVSPNILELLYVYNTKPTFRIFKILIPLSLPHVFIGLKVSTTMAIMGAVVAEFMGAKDGLGKNLYLAPKNSQADLMICSIALIIGLGFLFFRSVTFLESYVCAWHMQTSVPST